MGVDPRDGLGRARAFLREGLWRVELEPRTWAARATAGLQLAVMIAEGFVRDHLLLRASALAYFTVLSMVPMLAIAVSIVGSVGVGDEIAELAVGQIAAGSPDAQATILRLIERADFRGLGTLGAVALFLTTVLGISSIEEALNGIWGVRQSRPWTRRLPDYLAVLVVAPLLLGAALSFAGTLRNEWLVQRLLEVPGFAAAWELGLRHAPIVVLAAGLAFLYGFLPNTSVRWGSAALGGLVAAALVTAAQNAYLGFSIGAARANALYGGFALLPLLLVWIYVFWAIVLLGAELAFAHQNLALYRREVRGRAAGPAEREAVGLRLALEIGRAFRDGAPAWTEDALAEALGVPVRTVRGVLAELEAAKAVAALDPGARGRAWQLGRPAERILVADLLAALRGAREPLVGGDPALGLAVGQLLAEIDEASAKGAGGRSLADALAALPPARPAPPSRGS
jgi:membrane protein